jgi:hypothetical protein
MAGSHPEEGLGRQLRDVAAAAHSVSGSGRCGCYGGSCWGQGQAETGGNAGLLRCGGWGISGKSLSSRLALMRPSEFHRAGTPASSKWSISETCFAAWAS